MVLLSNKALSEQLMDTVYEFMFLHREENGLINSIHMSN